MSWTIQRWLRRGKQPLKVLAILAIPYVPLMPAAWPSSAGLDIEPKTLLTGPWGTSRGSVGIAHPDGPSALFSREAVRLRSRSWEIKRLESCGWRLLLSARTAVRSDIGLDALRAVGAHADAFIEALDRRLEGDSSGLRFSIRFFRSRHEFDVYASVRRAAGADSFYDIENAEAVLYWPHDGDPWRLLMHELAHMYLDRVLGRREPLWLMEGVAEYFARYRAERGGCAPGADDRDRMRGIMRVAEDGGFVPLRRLLEAQREEFYGERHPLYYSEAWSLVKFIASHEDPERPGALWELVRGKGLEHVWNRAELERTWTGWIRSEAE